MVDKTDAHSEEEFQDKNFIEDPAQLDMYKAAGVIADGKFIKDLFQIILTTSYTSSL